MCSANNLGKRLKQIRSDMGISQEELAYRCNMQASHISQIERGQKSPTLDTLEKLAAGLNITVSVLTDYATDISFSGDEFVNKINSYLIKLNNKQKKQILSIIKTFFNN